MTHSERKAAILQDPVGTFSEAELQDLPEPVKRYFRGAIAPGTALARTAQIRMRGSIKLGRWLPFRGHEIVNPHTGFVWTARVALIISGADSYAAGDGGMDWKLLGLKHLVHAEGPDVSRSAAARGAAEGVWVPTALLPRFGVEWTAEDERHIQAAWSTAGHPFSMCLRLREDGQVVSVVFDRWGDPDQTGTWGVHPFGGEMDTHGAFGGVTIPTSGRMGWFYGTDRWPESGFFRFHITDVTLVTTSGRGS